VEAQQCVKLSRTNRSIGLNASLASKFLSMPSDGIRKSDQITKLARADHDDPATTLSFAGLVAQVRSAYTRSHPELGRETLQRQ
jgi:hypothetical protein